MIMLQRKDNTRKKLKNRSIWIIRSNIELQQVLKENLKYAWSIKNKIQEKDTWLRD